MILMKKFLPLIILLTVFFSSSFNAVSAANPVANTVRTRLEAKIEAREEKLLQIQQRVTNRIQERTASREARLNQLRQGLIKNYYAQMSERLWATIARLEILITRIEARVSLVQSEGVKDLTSVNSNIASAKTLLSDTKVLLTSADEMIDDVIASQDPKSSFAVLRENVNDIKSNLKEVHRLLVKVIGDIAGLRVGTAKISPSPTPAAN